MNVDGPIGLCGEGRLSWLVPVFALCIQGIQGIESRIEPGNVPGNIPASTFR